MCDESSFLNECMTALKKTLRVPFVSNERGRVQIALRSRDNGKSSAPVEMAKSGGVVYPGCDLLYRVLLPEMAAGIFLIFTIGNASREFGMGLVDGSGFALHIIHQEVFAQRVRGGEVGLAAAHFGDLLDELHEAEV